ncbi:MAG TPA: hypothetical protein VHU89_10730 [Acidobacteriaceae bacterium]|jgi:hypothetical protein|nr:hypothetical protein [Acidobacteriaceae bacterium]
MAERDDPEATRAAHWGEIAAGLMAAAIVAYWSHPGIDSRAALVAATARGALWLVATVTAGTLGMALAGGFAGARGRHRLLLTGMNAAAVWVLIPPLLLLCFEASPKLLALVAATAAGLAVCLRAAAPGHPEDHEAEPIGEGPRFAELPPSRSGAKLSALIAVLLEAACILWLRNDPFWAAVWLALGSLLLVWKTLASLTRPERRLADPRRRLGSAAMAAIAVVVALLLVRPHPGMAGLAGGAARASARTQGKETGAAVDDAYRGIVLFTVTDKTKELPPLPLERNPLRAGTNRPVVIPFDGSYWYFQAPQHGPGLHPHLAHGDPVAMNISSTGWVPLAMQAHQTLAQPIPVHGGEGFALTLRNGDNRDGRIEVGVLLTDSRARTLDKPTLILGVKPMLTSEPPEFAYKTRPVEEDLTFAIPQNPALRQFDTITVLFFPSAVRDTLGARVGIRQFALLPR